MSGTESTTIEISWTEVAGADRYELWEFWDFHPGWQLIKGDLQSTSYSRHGLTPGRTYHYAVRAVAANGVVGAWSNYPFATVPEVPTPTPTSGPTPTPTSTPTPNGLLPAPSITVSGTATTSIEITWTEVTGADRYELWEWWDFELDWQRIEDSLQGTSYTSHGLTPGRTYYYAVRAVDANGVAGEWSDYPHATVPTNAVSNVEREKAALIALYEATGGANWTNNGNWLSAEPLSTWHGVTTDTNGSVTDLRLSTNGLSGSIPNLSALTNLSVLDLSTNQLTGQIPNLDAFTNLTILFLGTNQLNGSIPSLATLTNLTTLDLYENELTGTIPDMSALTNLTWLILADNQLEGQIPDLSPLTELTILGLSENLLEGQIPDLSALTKLTTINLGNNQLEGQIPALGALSDLESLNLGNNQLVGPVPDMSALTSLTWLSLSGNQLCIPAGTDLSTLHSDVSAHLQGLNLPDCVGYFERAALVALYEATDGASWTQDTNWLTDEPLSTWYGVTTDSNARVTELRLPSNELTGTIPDLSALTELTALDLNTNPLSGSIPDLSALTNLTSLNLSFGLFDGTISDLSALTNLTSLNLSSNDLTGSIPDLGALTELASIDLSGNDLCLPASTDLSQLITVVADHLRSLNLSACTDP